MPPRIGIRYRPFPHQRPLYQGDIVSGVPVLAVPPNQTRWVLLRPPTNSGITLENALRGQRPNVFVPRSEEALPDAWQLSAELVVAKALKTPVIIVTQTCDLDHRKHFQVAPIKTAAEFDGPK